MRNLTVPPLPSLSEIFPVNIEIKDVSPTRKNLVVSLAADEVDTEYQAVIGEFALSARLPGFRPGKAPANMVLMRYRKEIGEEFKQKVIAKAYRGGIDQAKLDVVQVTAVEEGAIAPATAATLTITVDLRPEFTLPDYIGLPTEVKPAEPTDAEVESVLEAMRAERADFQPVPRATQKGDYVKLAYEGTVDGKPILELVPDKQIYGKVPQTWEEIEGANEGIIPGLGRVLGDLKAGDKKDVTVTFPADFAGAPALAGKTATYAVEIQEVRERVLPALDEAFFKSHQADSLDGLKASIRHNLTLRKAQENHTAQRRQVAEALAAKVEFAVPESLVEMETQNMLRRFIEENMRRGVTADQFEKDKESLYEGARKSATLRVKQQLLFAKVAEQEKITVTEQDIDTFIYQEAARTNQTPEKLAKELGKARERLRSIQQAIIFDKALDLLVAKAKVTTVPASA